MIIKIRKLEVEKVIECHGYVRTRFAYNTENDSEQRELGLDEATPKGWSSSSIISPRGLAESAFGAIVVPENAANRVFILNDRGDTIDRLVWG